MILSETVATCNHYQTGVTSFREKKVQHLSVERFSTDWRPSTNFGWRVGLPSGDCLTMTIARSACKSRSRTTTSSSSASTRGRQGWSFMKAKWGHGPPSPEDLLSKYLVLPLKFHVNAKLGLARTFHQLSPLDISKFSKEISSA